MRTISFDIHTRINGHYCADPFEANMFTICLTISHLARLTILIICSLMSDFQWKL